MFSNNTTSNQAEINKIGTVKLIIGQVSVRNSDGTISSLHVNSPIFLNDTVVTGENGMVSILFNDTAQTQLDLGRSSTVLIDEDIYPENEGPALMSNMAADAEAIQETILAGTFDPTTDLPATAAGGPTAAATADGGGGQVLYIEELTAQTVTPESGADTVGTAFSFVTSVPASIAAETLTEESTATLLTAAATVETTETETTPEQLTAIDYGSCFGYSSYEDSGDLPPAVLFDVLANDDNGGVGSTLTGVSISSSSIGTVAIVNNTIEFTPGPDFSEQTSVSYTFTNADGDTVQGTLIIQERYFILGENTDDTDNGDNLAEYVVGSGSGTITGGEANDILVGDYGGVEEEGSTTSMNLIIILDDSWSMDNTGESPSKLEQMQTAIENLLNELAANYDSYDTVRVHLIEFATGATDDGTYDIIVNGTVDTTALADAINTINNISVDSNDAYTNYEAALQEALDWTSSSEPLTGDNVINTTLFLTDGEPSAYNDDDGWAVVSTSDTVTPLQEILGSDGTNEVAELQNWGYLHTVGINDNGLLPTLQEIATDSDHAFVYPQATLASALPASLLADIDLLTAAGDDTINGGGGDDLIFGDVLYTDDLVDNLLSSGGIIDATTGLSLTIYDTGLASGSGFAVFQALENDTSIEWTRTDTINYILNNSDSLSQSSISGIYGQRADGDDTIIGGDGDDTIYAQEGDDTVVGGDGEDNVDGGIGADLLMGDDIEVVSSTDANIIEDGDADIVDGGSGSDGMGDNSTPNEDTYTDVEYQASDTDIDNLAPIISTI